MDIKSFLKLINKYKWLLILVPIIAVTITFFLVQNLPREYSSEVQISTGLLDPSKQINTGGNVDFFMVNQQFNSIIEKLKMKKVINILSYNLILHDLEHPKEAFREYSEKIDSLNDDQKQEVILAFKEKLMEKSILTLKENDGKYKLLDIVSSMGYGEYALSKTIEVTHVDNSDNITLEFTSENPKLSAYIVNTLATEFISNYSSDVNFNQNNSIVLLDSLLKSKERIMNTKNNSLSDFKRNRGVLNLGEQSAVVYGQISDYEAQRIQALKEIQSKIGAISIIDTKLNGQDPLYSGSSRKDNREIIDLKRKLEIASATLIDGNYKPADQRKVDSLKTVINLKSDQNSDENLFDPRASKQSLVQQKLALEVAMQQAKSSINSLDKQLALLKARYSSMVPYDAEIQNYEREAELATKDYMTALDRYNNTRNEQNLGLKLQIDQVGLPGLPLPSKKKIYLAASGGGSFFLVLGVIMLIGFLDNRINNSNQLFAATNIPVLGNLNYLTSPDKSIRNIWNDESNNSEYIVYKNLLRSLRFEISKSLIADSNNVLGITSLGVGEGTTNTAYNLSYSFAMIGKKVLLIGEEPKFTSAVSETSIVKTQNFESFITKKEIVAEDLITVLNKDASNTSILEMQNERSLKNGFDILKEQFDVIIIDINSLRETNIAKEWLSFTEKSIAVFEAGRALNDQDKEWLKYLKDYPGFMGWVLNKIKLTDLKAGESN